MLLLLWHAKVKEFHFHYDMLTIGYSVRIGYLLTILYFKLIITKYRGMESDSDYKITNRTKSNTSYSQLRGLFSPPNELQFKHKIQDN